MGLTDLLLKKIRWYSPKACQKIYVNPKTLENLHQIGYDRCTCGIEVIISNYVKELEVQMVVPDDMTDNTCPIPSDTLLQHKHIGMIGYALSYLYRKRSASRQKINSHLSEVSRQLVRQYLPQQVTTTLTWGLDLVFAYVASTYESEVSFISPDRHDSETGVMYYWDDQSKLMASELITEKGATIRHSDTMQLCKIEVMNSCDFCIMQVNDKSRNKLFLNNAKANNIPVIKIMAWTNE